MKTKFFAILGFVLVCNSSFVIKDQTKHFVGELYGGGIVFYAEKNGKHGLIASLNDIGTEMRLFTMSTYRAPQSSNKWRNKEISEPSAPNLKIKTNDWNGLMNTDIIVKSGHDLGAASICKKYTAGDYTDWYLPAVIELEKLMSTKEVINGILNNDNNQKTQGLSSSYWSSSLTQQGTSDIWAYQDEIKMIKSQDNFLNVRAIRKF